MDFVSTKGILDRAVTYGVISNEERPTFESFLNTYDRALDGKLDGGFGKKQIGVDTYVQIGHPVHKIREQIEKLNRLTLSILKDKKDFEPKKSFGQLAGDAAVFGAKVAWAMINPAACGDGHCDGCEMDLCYKDEEKNIICGCPPGEEIGEEDCSVQEVCRDIGGGVDECGKEIVCSTTCRSTY